MVRNVQRIIKEASIESPKVSTNIKVVRFEEVSSHIKAVDGPWRS